MTFDDLITRKPNMIFELGRTYKHATGKKMRIIAEIDTYFYGHCLLGETDSADYVPVGMTEEHTVNWEECLDFNKEEK